MTALDSLLTVEAFVTGDAQARTTVRHRHLAADPMVIVAYRLAGEAGAPLGVMYGTSPSDAKLLVAPEPRNRDMRFREVFEPLASDINQWLITGFSERNDDEECVSCPQILVPNRGTAEFVGSVLGRSLRYLRSSDEFPVSDDVVTLGAHATWFAQQAETPGSCVLVAATDLLRRHWATGQSSLEDEDLHVLLAWIDPPDRTTGKEAAQAAEWDRVAGVLPAVGPTPDASWDRDVLAPLLEDFNTTRNGDTSQTVVATHGDLIRQATSEALERSWEATWRAHTLLSSLPEGGSVAERWVSDTWAWCSHLRRVEADRAFFRTRDSARQSAWMIKSRENAQQALERGEVLDDPLVLAGIVASGEAIHGTVTNVDTTNMEMGPSGTRRVRRPLITVELPEPCPLPMDTEVRWSDRLGLGARIITTVDNEVTLKVSSGMTGNLPPVGGSAAFVTFDTGRYPAPDTVPGVPWTHVGADIPTPDSEVPE